MKNKKLLMQVKTYVNSLFFKCCKWSMLITAYALIAIIIVMSSESYFSEGVYAAEVAYATEAYDFMGNSDVMCMGRSASDTDDSNQVSEIQEGEVQTLSVKALKENEAKMVYDAMECLPAFNVNIIDCVANDKTEKKIEKKKSKKAVDAFKNSESKIKISSTDKKILQRIVEAEATGEDITGKMLVANVVLNRVNNSHFPDSIEAVVFQKNGSVYQFSPIKDGRYYKVNISDETRKAVERVLKGEDKSEGALYFMSRSRAKASSVTWFDRSLTRVFKHGTHEFYK